MAEAANPIPSTPPDKGAEQAMVQFFAKLGFEVSPISKEAVAKALDPVQKYIRDFSKTADVKNTFFGKLPGIQKSLQAIMPDSFRFTKSLIEAGNASLAGADGMEFYNNSLGFMGKGLVRLTSLFATTGEASTVLGWTVQAALDTATLGIGAVIAVSIQLLQLFKNIIMVGLDWQDRLNQFNKILGGISRGALAEFNAGINTTITGLQQYGFSLSEILSTLKSYISTGLNPVKAMQDGLIKNTLLLSEITGQSGEELAGFFSNIIRGSKVSGDNIKSLGNSWTTFNKSVEASGIIGVVSFNDVQNAISSIGTALLVASNRGKIFTNTLTNDLVSLTGLAKALNIDVGNLNSKFEEASNLLTAQESGFRNILALSGGANIGNMLNNQYTRTDAMLKIVDTLANLNTQFGGNLNILGQVAEQTFGLSKDVAIKLATMSSEQRKALQQAKEDSIRLQNDSLQKSWESVTGTMSAQFDRFKNTMAAAIQRAFAGSDGVQGFLNKITSTLSRWINELNDPNSGFSRIVTKITDITNVVFNKASEWLDNIIPIFEDVKDALNTFMKAITGQGSFLKGLGNLLFTILEMPVKMLTATFVTALKSELSGGLGKNGGLFGKNPLLALIPVIGPLLHSMSAINGKIDKTDESINTIKTDIGSRILENKLSEVLKQNEQEQSRYSGLQDTDVVINKQGQFTLAGLEKLDLEAKHDSLVEEQNKVTEDNTNALKDMSDLLREQLRAKSGYQPDYVREGARVHVGTIAERNLESWKLRQAGKF